MANPIVLYVGETHITFNCTWTDDAGALVNLTNPDTTNATLSVRWHTDTLGRVSRLGDGTFAGGPRSGGKFTYQVSANDVLNADLWLLQFKAVYVDGTVLFTDPVSAEVRTAL